MLAKKPKKLSRTFYKFFLYPIIICMIVSIIFSTFYSYIHLSDDNNSIKLKDKINNWENEAYSPLIDKIGYFVGNKLNLGIDAIKVFSNYAKDMLHNQEVNTNYQFIDDFINQYSIDIDKYNILTEEEKVLILKQKKTINILNSPQQIYIDNINRNDDKINKDKNTDKSNNKTSLDDLKMSSYEKMIIYHKYISSLLNPLFQSVINFEDYSGYNSVYIAFNSSGLFSYYRNKDNELDLTFFMHKPRHSHFCKLDNKKIYDFTCRRWFNYTNDMKVKYPNQDIVVSPIYKNFSKYNSLQFSICSKIFINKDYHSFNSLINHSQSNFEIEDYMTICLDVNGSDISNKLNEINSNLRGSFVILQKDSTVPFYFPSVYMEISEGSLVKNFFNWNKNYNIDSIKILDEKVEYFNNLFNDPKIILGAKENTIKKIAFETSDEVLEALIKYIYLDLEDIDNYNEDKKKHYNIKPYYLIIFIVRNLALNSLRSIVYKSQFYKTILAIVICFFLSFIVYLLIVNGLRSLAYDITNPIKAINNIMIRYFTDNSEASRTEIEKSIDIYNKNKKNSIINKNNSNNDNNDNNDKKTTHKKLINKTLDKDYKYKNKQSNCNKFNNIIQSNNKTSTIKKFSDINSKTSNYLISDSEDNILESNEDTNYSKYNINRNLDELSVDINYIIIVVFKLNQLRRLENKFLKYFSDEIPISERTNDLFDEIKDYFDAKEIFLDLGYEKLVSNNESNFGNLLISYKKYDKAINHFLNSLSYLFINGLEFVGDLNFNINEEKMLHYLINSNGEKLYIHKYNTKDNNKLLNHIYDKKSSLESNVYDAEILDTNSYSDNANNANKTKNINLLTNNINYQSFKVCKNFEKNIVKDKKNYKQSKTIYNVSNININNNNKRSLIPFSGHKYTIQKKDESKLKSDFRLNKKNKNKTIKFKNRFQQFKNFFFTNIRKTMKSSVLNTNNDSKNSQFHAYDWNVPYNNFNLNKNFLNINNSDILQLKASLEHRFPKLLYSYNKFYSNITKIIQNILFKFNNNIEVTNSEINSNINMYKKELPDVIESLKNQIIFYNDYYLSKNTHSLISYEYICKKYIDLSNIYYEHLLSLKKNLIMNSNNSKNGIKDLFKIGLTTDNKDNSTLNLTIYNSIKKIIESYLTYIEFLINNKLEFDIEKSINSIIKDSDNKYYNIKTDNYINRFNSIYSINTTDNFCKNEINKNNACYNNNNDSNYLDSIRDKFLIDLIFNNFFKADTLINKLIMNSQIMINNEFNYFLYLYNKKSSITLNYKDLIYYYIQKNHFLKGKVFYLCCDYQNALKFLKESRQNLNIKDAILLREATVYIAKSYNKILLELSKSSKISFDLGNKLDPKIEKSIIYIKNELLLELKNLSYFKPIKKDVNIIIDNNIIVKDIKNTSKIQECVYYIYDNLINLENDRISISIFNDIEEFKLLNLTQTNPIADKYIKDLIKLIGNVNNNNNINQLARETLLYKESLKEYEYNINSSLLNNKNSIKTSSILFNNRYSKHSNFKYSLKSSSNLNFKKSNYSRNSSKTVNFFYDNNNNINNSSTKQKSMSYKNIDIKSIKHKDINNNTLNNKYSLRHIRSSKGINLTKNIFNSIISNEKKPMLNITKKSLANNSIRSFVSPSNYSSEGSVSLNQFKKEFKKTFPEEAKSKGLFNSLLKIKKKIYNKSYENYSQKKLQKINKKLINNTNNIINCKKNAVDNKENLDELEMFIKNSTDINNKTRKHFILFMSEFSESDFEYIHSKGNKCISNNKYKLQEDFEDDTLIIIYTNFSNNISTENTSSYNRSIYLEKEKEAIDKLINLLNFNNSKFLFFEDFTQLKGILYEFGYIEESVVFCKEEIDID